MIAALAGLAGAFINSRSQKKANAANRPASQVAQWEEAGINPIVGITQGNYVPVQANFAIGDGFSEAGARFEHQQNVVKQREIEETEVRQENQRLREQLDDVANSGPPSHMQSYGPLLPVPSEVSSRAQTSHVHSQDVSVSPVSDVLDGDGDILYDPDRTSIDVAGVRTRPDWRWSDAELVEQRYGDVASAVYGLGVIGADGFNTARQMGPEHTGSPDDPNSRFNQRLIASNERDMARAEADRQRDSERHDALDRQLRPVTQRPVDPYTVHGTILPIDPF